MTDEVIYLRLSGPTASFRIPIAVTATQLALSVPGYSSVLGMISYAAGREVTPEDTRIGYKYSYGFKGLDLETFHRWGRNNSGNLSYNQTSIRKREVHYNVSMELVIDNTDLFEEIKYPSRQLTFGRSQDLATLEQMEIVECEKVESGPLWGSLLPIDLGDDLPGEGMFHNLPEFFEYFEGKTRRPRGNRTFLALSQERQEVQHQNLVKINFGKGSTVIYLHDWNNR